MSGFSSYGRLAGRASAVLGILAGMAMTSASTAVSQNSISPYLEVQQVLNADMNESDVLTYTSVAAGVNGQASTRRLKAQISYRYQRHIDWKDPGNGGDVHSGLSQLRYEAIANMLSLDAGALATSANTGGRGPVFGFNNAPNPGASQVYSAYAGPTVSTHVGPVSVGASYRFGAVKAENRAIPAGAGIDRHDQSLSHSVSASVGMSPGELPFGWTVGAGYVREDTNRLDREMEGKYVRGDVVVPVAHTLAVTAGIGYEDIISTQQDVRRGPNGVPIVGPGGQFIADPTKPRLLAYDQSGLIYDAGVIWRPSRRTELQARVGHRYGGLSYTGSFSHKLADRWGISASVYDTFSSFGLTTINAVSGLPTNFNVSTNPLAGGLGSIGGCIFGVDPGTGTCFSDAFQSLNSSNFRSRGANLLLSGGRGPWSYGLGGGYANRRYVTPGTGPGGFTMDGVVEESFSLSGNLGRQLTRTSSANFDAFASWFDSSRTGAEPVFSTGFSTSYNRALFHNRLQGFAAFGVYTTSAAEQDSTNATGLVGLRYSF